MMNLKDLGFLTAKSTTRRKIYQSAYVTYLSSKDSEGEHFGFKTRINPSCLICESRGNHKLIQVMLIFFPIYKVIGA